MNDSEQIAPKSTPIISINKHNDNPLCCKAYRIHFSCQNVGRYFRSSKRRIRWIFGLTNQTAINEGKSGIACRGEEHDVELVWSVKSGKTGVYWNKVNISNLFRDKSANGKVDISWQTRLGETIQISANTERVSNKPQYDLLFDGVSFFDLAALSQVGSRDLNFDDRSLVDDSSNSVSELLEDDSVVLDNDDDIGEDHEIPVEENQEFRLSMVGLKATLANEAIVDELRSELYSSSLDLFRTQVTYYLPQAEEIISRSIMNAFTADEDSQYTVYSFDSLSDWNTDPYQLEVDTIMQAMEWINRYTALGGSRTSEENILRLFLQKKIEKMMILIRNEQVTPESAARMILSASTVLGLRFANSIRKDSIILYHLPHDCTIDQLRLSLSYFGQIDGLAVSQGQSPACLCRFRSLEAAQKAVSFWVKTDSGAVSVLLGDDFSLPLYTHPTSNSSSCESPDASIEIRSCSSGDEIQVFQTNTQGFLTPVCGYHSFPCDEMIPTCYDHSESFDNVYRVLRSPTSVLSSVNYGCSCLRHRTMSVSS